ncbi:response regulator [Azospirillum sp. B21]|uniref:ATP-binding protein n=1 Tax=Azospirillum sp. B21 TaxID=2607496 RepID=UPI0011F01A2C|nr:ATP-binding protein [Azospirillum sp. B21]KAA0574372.1 response regulator [Azospirillum sp. B21]
MFRHSLARLVLALQWASILALGLITSLLAGQEWLAYLDAQRIVGLTHADRVLFQSMTGIRYEVGVTGVAVLTHDDARALVHESYRTVDAYYRSALASIGETGIEERDSMLEAARQSYAALERTRVLIAEQLRHPLTDRDMAPAEPWRQAMFDVVGRLGDASIAVGNTVRMLDPTIAELVQVRQSSYVIRERYGRPCSTFRPNIQRNVPLDRGQLEAWREDVGAYTSRWRDLETILRRPGAPAQLIEDVRAGRLITEAVQARMDEILHGLNGSGGPAMPAAEWSQLCVSAYDAILTLGEHALDLAIARADERKAEAFLMLVGMAGLAVTSLLLGGLSIVVVRRRLSQPMTTLVATIGRLSRQEFDAPVPATGYPDETGVMAGALEELRIGALRAQHLHRLLDEARDGEIRQANELNRAKTAFLATMSHEVRTPLNGILGMVQLLEDSPLTDRQRQWLDAISKSGSLLLAVLNDVLDFSKIEAGRMELEAIPFSPESLLQTVTATMKPQAAAKGLSFHCEHPPLPASLLGDPAKLGQVLLNLVSNAVKFTHAGGVTLSARCLEEAAGSGRVRLEFKVVDTGIGMTPEAVGHVFDAFAQGDSSITRRFGGTGLGLAICKRIVGMMGGDIAVTSVPGRGSTFTVVLEVPEAVTGPGVAGLPALAEPLPSLSILLAEDNEVNAAVAVTMLERMGHTVTHAADGCTAAKLAAETDYDVVITDLAMPGLDGVGLTRCIRALPHVTRREVPVVALTADVATDRLQHCLAAGMTGYLEKPFRRDDIERVLAESIGALEAICRPPSETTLTLLEERANDLGEELAGRIVELFATTAPALSAEAAEAARIGDAGAFGDAVHRLKGAAGQVGLRTLAQLARQAEQAAASHPERIRDCAEAITAEVPLAVRALHDAWVDVLSERARRTGSPPRVP